MIESQETQVLQQPALENILDQTGGQGITSQDLDRAVGILDEKINAGIKSIKDLTQKQEEDIKSFKKELSEDVRDAKRDNITILSIFIAIIAFLFAGFQVLSNVKGIKNQFGLVVIIGFLLLGFVWLLNIILTSGGSDKIKSGKISVGKYLFTAAVIHILLLVIFCIASVSHIIIVR